MDSTGELLVERWNEIESGKESLLERLDASRDLNALTLLEIAKLSEDLRSLHDCCMDLLQELVQRSPERKDHPVGLASAEITLLGLKTLLDDFRAAEAQAEMLAALSVIEKVLRIRHRTAESFPALDEFHREVRSIKEQVKADPSSSVVGDLVEGTHPYCLLLRFVENFDELDDTEWSDLQSSLKSQFSPAVVAAAGRGRLECEAVLTREDGSDLTTEASVQRETEREPAVNGDPIDGVNAPSSSPPGSSNQTPAVNNESIVDASVVGPHRAFAPSKPSNPSESPDRDSQESYTQSANEPPESLEPGESQEAARQDDSQTPKLEQARETNPQIEAAPALPSTPDAKSKDESDDYATETHSSTSENSEARYVVDARNSCEDTGTGEALQEEQQCVEMTSVSTRGMRDWVWKLVADGRLGLAGTLANALNQALPDSSPQFPVWLLRAVSLSPYLAQEHGEVAVALQKDLAWFTSEEDLTSGEDEDWRDSIRLLLFAATARATLLSPRIGATRILRSLRVNNLSTHLADLRNHLCAFSAGQTPLEPSILREVKSEAAWQADLEHIQKETSEYAARATRFSMVYAPATKVWGAWLGRNGLIQNLLETVKNNDTTQIELIRTEMSRLSNQANVRKELDYTDRKVLGRRIGAQITARALAQVQMHVAEALEFPRKWLALHDSKPGRSTGYQQSAAQHLWAVLKPLCTSALSDLERRIANRHPRRTCAAASECRKSINSIISLFDVDHPFSALEPDPKVIRQRELLLIPDIPLDTNWEPTISGAELQKRLTSFLLSEQASFETIFDCYLQRGDHEATDRVLTILESDNPELASKLSEHRDQALLACRRDLKRDVEEVRKNVYGAMNLGALHEKEQVELCAKLDQLIDTSDEVIRFDVARDNLSSILKAVRDRKEALIEGVRQRLYQLAPDHPDRARIAALLDKEDLVTANDFIELLRRGETLPGENLMRDPLCDFFPEKLQQIERQVEEDRSPVLMINRVRDQRSFCGIDMSQVPGGHAAQASELLDYWFRVKRTHQIDSVTAKNILDRLGFNVLSVKVRSLGRKVWMEVTTDVVSSREFCPIPQFGSLAQGRYLVFCTWDRPADKDLLADIGDAAHNNAVIVLYFARMPERKRRELATSSIRNRRSFVLIDESLIVYLCGERDSRLPAMFKCSLPFTFAQPYTTTAGLVAPEMFYGRDYERESIIDRMGSCFIYGGRQLGKTVLLRDVERRFHDAKLGRLALWFDLKTRGIGYNRAIDDIWTLLASELKRVEVLPANVPPQTSVDRILEYVEAWLQAEKSRRLLLLLDEADRFLEIDSLTPSDRRQSSGFERVAKLKGLMDRTERRFKVVFAGLHNVQRTTRLANHPLAHYGEPLCIGPLLDRGEWREAKKLIEEPLGALGFRFESPDLVMRVIAQCNYYPSLVQLHCSHLLQHVRSGGARFDPQASPPYTLTSQHLEDAYHSRDLKKAIKDRLLWTLQLDGKYEVIAYSIAYEFLLDRDRGMVDGFSLSEIRQNALGCWAEGFTEHSTEEAFEVLLDEMVGLGVLRLSSPRHYTLRTPNVLRLMGSLEDVEAALLMTREAVPEYESVAFRSARPDGGYRRHPLTAQQEAVLRTREHGVSIVFGVEQSGVSELQEFLTAGFGADFMLVGDGISNVMDFERWLATLEKRSRDGINVVLIPAASDWGCEWVERAVQKCARLTSRGSFVRFVFVAGGDLTWKLAEASHDFIGAFRMLGVSTLSLGPWGDAMVRQWLDDCGYRNMAEVRERTRVVSGNWSTSLYKMHEYLRDNDGDLAERLAEFERKVQDSKFAEQLLIDFSLRENGPAHPIVQLARLNSAATVEDIAAIAEIPVEIARSAIAWGDALNIVRAIGRDQWRVNEFVSKLVSIARPE